MVKEFERAGFPIVQMCNLIPAASTVGANRMVPTILMILCALVACVLVTGPTSSWYGKWTVFYWAWICCKPCPLSLRFPFPCNQIRFEPR